MNVEEAVGMELSACRYKKRIGQEQLGFDAEVHRTYVSLINGGAKEIPETIHRYLGIDCPLRRFLPSPAHLEWHGSTVFQG